jgi:hypothetical protein
MRIKRKAKPEFSKADIANLIHMVGRHADMLVLLPEAEMPKSWREVAYKAMSIVDVNVHEVNGQNYLLTSIDPKTYKVGR